jgi:hypothetical protein
MDLPMMERVGDRWEKMEESFSIGQSPQWALVPVEEEYIYIHIYKHIYIYPSIQPYSTSYISRLGNTFRFITIHHRAFLVRTIHNFY